MKLECSQWYVPCRSSENIHVLNKESYLKVAAGNGLIEDGKGDISIIKERNVALQALWEDLNSASTTKSLKLGEARQQQQ